MQAVVAIATGALGFNFCFRKTIDSLNTLGALCKQISAASSSSRDRPSLAAIVAELNLEFKFEFMANLLLDFHEASASREHALLLAKTKADAMLMASKLPALTAPPQSSLLLCHDDDGSSRAAADNKDKAQRAPSSSPSPSFSSFCQEQNKRQTKKHIENKVMSGSKTKQPIKDSTVSMLDALLAASDPTTTLPFPKASRDNDASGSSPSTAALLATTTTTMTTTTTTNNAASVSAASALPVSGFTIVAMDGEDEGEEEENDGEPTSRCNNGGETSLAVTANTNNALAGQAPFSSSSLSEEITTTTTLAGMYMPKNAPTRTMYYVLSRIRHHLIDMRVELKRLMTLYASEGWLTRTFWPTEWDRECQKLRLKTMQLDEYQKTLLQLGPMRVFPL